MSHAISLERSPVKSAEATIDAIARDTATTTDVVKILYEEQVTLLAAEARIMQFVSVIATKRVKQHLRRLATA
jgi:hypothetical protein